MKRVLVLGATGRTGRHLVNELLQAAHDVTVFVRDPSRLQVEPTRLTVRVGQLPDDRDALITSVRTQDAVISTLGAGNSLQSRGLMARGVPGVIEAMISAGLQRFIFTSAYGVGTSQADIPFLPRMFAATLLRDLYADKEIADAMIRRSPLAWTIVYPVALTNGPRTGHWRAAEHLPLRGWPRISRADVAAFLARQVEDPDYVRRGVVIAS
jgi:putative NADH-flavin reductase